MGYMDYANYNQINIIPKEDFENLVQETFDVIAANLCKSLGPLGSSATILDGMMTEATKDGYSILSKYRFNNRYKKMIYNLILAPCRKMNNTVGDGTTTAIALTNAIFNRYKERKPVFDSLYRLPRQFNAAWDQTIAEIIERVSEKATPIDPEDYDTIYNLAYVTSNGSHEISDAIASTYKEAKSPAIKQKDSPTNKSYIKPINGFEFPANAIDVVYVRNQDLSAEEKDIAVMIFDHKIESDLFSHVLIPINNVMRARGKKLLIIAPSYDAYMCESVLKQYVNQEYQQYRAINLILTQYKIGDLTPHQVEDLAVVLRAKTINEDLAANITNRLQEVNVDMFIEEVLDNNQYDLYKVVGSASKVLITCKNGSIFNVQDVVDDPEYQEALLRAKNELDDLIAHTDNEKQSYAAKIYDARSRIMQLEMKNYIYYVGADSDLQKQIIWDSIEDVIKCLRSAIKYGTVPGCQLSIMEVCNDMMGDTLANNEKEDLTDEVKLKFEIIGCIFGAASDVYAQLLHGASGRGIISMMEDSKIKKPERRPGETDEEYQEALNKIIADIQQRAIKKGDEIITESIEKMQVFDLESMDYSDKIITSVQTDTMVLTVASELVKILISGNQCVFLDASQDEDVQQDNVAMYV